MANIDIVALAKHRYATKAFDPNKKLAEADFQALMEVMRNAPSSVNSQPWRIFVASDEAGKARIAKATQESYAFNNPKVVNASHVIVIASKTELGDGYLEMLLDQEEADGRYAPNPDFKAMNSATRARFVAAHAHDKADWAEKQCFLSLGMLLLAASALEVDAVPIEGFDHEIMDNELGLRELGLRSSVIVAFGFRAEDDFNAKLPKSRLPKAEIFTKL